LVDFFAAVFFAAVSFAAVSFAAVFFAAVFFAADFFAAVVDFLVVFFFAAVFAALRLRALAARALTRFWASLARACGYSGRRFFTTFLVTFFAACAAANVRMVGAPPGRPTAGATFSISTLSP
jgi:hypothetical protein